MLTFNTTPSEQASFEHFLRHKFRHLPGGTVIRGDIGGLILRSQRKRNARHACDDRFHRGGHGAGIGHIVTDVGDWD